MKTFSFGRWRRWSSDGVRRVVVLLLSAAACSAAVELVDVAANCVELWTTVWRLVPTTLHHRLESEQKQCSPRHDRRHNHSSVLTLDWLIDSDKFLPNLLNTKTSWSLWSIYGFTSYSTQNGSFWRLCSRPVPWLLYWECQTKHNKTEHKMYRNLE